jgi:hypothetical protein
MNGLFAPSKIEAARHEDPPYGDCNFEIGDLLWILVSCIFFGVRDHADVFG